MRAKFNKEDKRVVIHEGEFLRFVKKGEWEYVERNNCCGIVIVVSMTKDHKVVLVEQYRPPVDCHVIEFPAGLVGDIPSRDGAWVSEETIEMAAIRELFEETGYMAKEIKILLDGPVSGGSSANIVTIVRALDIEKTGPGGGDDTESIRVHEVDLDQIDEWLNAKRQEGFLVEPKIYAGLYFLKQCDRR